MKVPAKLINKRTNKPFSFAIVEAHNTTLKVSKVLFAEHFFVINSETIEEAVSKFPLMRKQHESVRALAQEACTTEPGNGVYLAVHGFVLGGLYVSECKHSVLARELLKSLISSN